MYGETLLREAAKAGFENDFNFLRGRYDSLMAYNSTIRKNFRFTLYGRVLKWIICTVLPSSFSVCKIFNIYLQKIFTHSILFDIKLKIKKFQNQMMVRWEVERPRTKGSCYQLNLYAYAIIFFEER